MKRFLSTLLAVVLVWACVAANLSALASAYGHVIATGQVNIREGAGLDYDSLGVLKKGAKLEYAGEKRKDSRGVAWYRVSYKGTDNAWVSSKYAKLSSDASTVTNSSGSGSSGSKTVTTTGSVNLRKGPGLDYKKIEAVKSGVKLTYLGEISVDDRGVEWYKVKTPDGDNAWVSSKYATLKGHTPAATKKPKPTATPEPEYEEYEDYEEDDLFAEWEFDVVETDTSAEEDDLFDTVEEADDEFEAFEISYADDEVLTKEQIQAQHGVANYNDLINVTGVEQLENGVFKIDFADDVYYGGTDGYADEWMTVNGIVAQADVDMDDDGTEEYLVVRVITQEVYQAGDMLRENRWFINIYDAAGGGYVPGAEFEVYPGNVDERMIRLVELEKGTGIMVGSIHYWDGMGGCVTGAVYGYGRFGAYVEAIFEASSEGESYVAYGLQLRPEAYQSAEAACRNFYWEPGDMAQHGLEEGLNFAYFGKGESSMPYDYENNVVKRENFAGLDSVKAIMADYGVDMGYTISPTADGGETYAFHLGGGEKLVWMNEGFDDDWNAYITIEQVGALDHIY